MDAEHTEKLKSKEKEDPRLLVLTGVELVFFIAASVGLCFGFLAEALVTTQVCFSYC